MASVRSPVAFASSISSKSTRARAPRGRVRESRRGWRPCRSPERYGSCQRPLRSGWYSLKWPRLVQFEVAAGDDDIVTGFGTDQTGALQEALEESNQQLSPTEAEQVASASASAHPTFGTVGGGRGRPPGASAKRHSTVQCERVEAIGHPWNGGGCFTVSHRSIMTRRLPVMPLVVVLIASTLLSRVSASPNFFEDDPVRPVDAALIKATSGILLKYTLVATDAIVSPRLTIRDAMTGKIRTFSLSFNTEFDGRRLKCTDASRGIRYWGAAEVVEENSLCTQLPATIIPGKTRVTLVYWNHKNASPVNFIHDYDQEPASDTVLVDRY